MTASWVYGCTIHGGSYFIYYNEVYLHTWVVGLINEG